MKIMRTAVLTMRWSACAAAPLTLAATLAFALPASAHVAPPGRAYELVSPPDKNGATVVSASTVLDGDTVLVTMNGAGRDDDSGNAGSPVGRATRGSSSWSFGSEMLGAGDGFFDIGTFITDESRDGKRSVYQGAKALASDDLDSAIDIFAREGGQFERVSTGSIGGNGNFPATYVGGSDDARHLLFTSSEHLEPADSPRVSGEQLYERVDGQTRVVGRKTDGSLVTTAGVTLGDTASGGGDRHAVSTDGSTIFFETPPSGVKQLYARVNGTTTVNVSSPQRTLPGNAASATRFAGASATGSKVLMLTGRQLLDSDTNATASTGMDLYQYDMGTNLLKRISGGADDTVQTARALGIAAMAEDASRVYFQARGVLAPGGVDGNANLYLYDALAGTTKLIASLPNSIVPAGPGSFPSRALTTPDGSVLVFPSDAALTSFDNGGMDEVYRYRTATGTVDCLSCNTTGTTPIGPARMETHKRAFLTGGSEKRNRFITDDGGTVVFQTDDAVSPEDTNGTTDAYLFTDQGVSLLSSGTDSAASFVNGLSADGRNAFFTTYERMVPQDVDYAADVYDARIGGGFPVATPPALCAGDACQGSPSRLPEERAPGTLGFVGPVNAINVPVASVAAKPTKKTLRGSSVAVKVTVPSGGWITATSRSTRRTKRTVARAGTYTVRVPLTSSAKKTVRRKGRLRVRIKVDFRPSSGMSSTVNVSATVKR